MMLPRVLVGRCHLSGTPPQFTLPNVALPEPGQGGKPHTYTAAAAATKPTTNCLLLLLLLLVHREREEGGRETRCSSNQSTNSVPPIDFSSHTKKGQCLTQGEEKQATPFDHRQWYFFQTKNRSQFGPENWPEKRMHMCKLPESK